MAELRVIGSGSSGNAYILQCNNETLLIELGMPWKDILKGLNYKIEDVAGCLVSHEHSDHANKDTIRKVIQYGIPTYSCEEVAKMCKGVNTIKKGRKTSIGGFKIQPVLMFHNVMNFGYVIEHEEIGKAVFCTDTNRIPYRFKNVNHLWVEANYSNDIMVDHLCDNVWSQSASENHMEINDTIDVLKENYNASLQTIILLHLSDGNSNEKKFIERIQEELGFFNVHIAKKNLTLQLEKEEF